MFKIGEKVWSYSLQEWGEVIEIGRFYETYPLVVKFPEGVKKVYTSHGKLCITHKAPDLFYSKVTITPPPRPLPDIPVDTKLRCKAIRPKREKDILPDRWMVSMLAGLMAVTLLLLIMKLTILYGQL